VPLRLTLVLMEKMLFSLLSIVCVGSSQGTPVRSWRPVFRQKLPGLWTKGQLSRNPDDPNNDMFAVLDKLDGMKSKAGGFNFKIRWPDPYMAETTTWRQTSNPFLMAQNKTAGVKGYEPVFVPQTTYPFGGLEYDTSGNCLMDGQPGTESWFYCIGYNGTDWGHGVAIPSFGRPAKAVELFVMDPKTMKWTLVYRQTLPHLMTQWVVNPDDPLSETYAIMDRLESFRNKTDGKFYFAINWPGRYNIWHQTNNPVKEPSGPGPTVPGYKMIDVQFTGAFWGGLQLNQNQSASILEGSVGAGATWFYAIGYQGADWGMKLIPAYNDGKTYFGSNNVELFVLVEK